MSSAPLLQLHPHTPTHTPNKHTIAPRQIRPDRATPSSAQSTETHSKPRQDAQSTETFALDHTKI
ncbi:hypothetical protein L6R29_20410 [Myxococcota bacterium]|nr:hypothetical protein [Myxococcota bacterium]